MKTLKQMKKEIADKYAAIQNAEVYTGGYLKTIGRKYITIVDTWETTSLIKMEIESFYRKYVS